MIKQPIRLVQTFVVSALALFATMVALGNLMDYGSNYDFVKHVLAMDTTFEGNNLMWRAITSEALVTVAYWTIIALEAAVAVLAWMASYRMVRSFKATSDKFTAAKSIGYWAFIGAILLWFVGFIVIGSEWFAMWQSDIWNGKQTAMDIVEVVGIFMVAFMLPADWSKK